MKSTILFRLGLSFAFVLGLTALAFASQGEGLGDRQENRMEVTSQVVLISGELACAQGNDTAGTCNQLVLEEQGSGKRIALLNTAGALELLKTGNRNVRIAGNFSENGKLVIRRIRTI